MEQFVKGEVLTAARMNELVDTIPSKNSQLENDSGFLTTHQDISGKQDVISDLDTIRSGAAAGATALQSYTETDPTVPSWAKTASKPTYTASEINTNASGVSVQDNLSQLALEVGEKVTEPTSEGTSGQVLTTDGNGGRTWTTVEGGGGGSEWKSVLLTEDDYNSTYKGFVIDAGEGKEIAEAIISGQISTDTVLTAAQNFYVGFGEYLGISASFMYFNVGTDKKFFALQGRAVSIYMGANQYGTDVYTQYGTGGYSLDSTQRYTFYIDPASNTTPQYYFQTYWGRNNPRYFGIKNIWDSVTWARIRIQYRLR